MSCPKPHKFSHDRQIDLFSLFKFNHLLANLTNDTNDQADRIPLPEYLRLYINKLQIDKKLARSMH